MYNEYEKYYIEQYDSLLEENNIDTVCFMGYGYNLDDVKIGCTFYLSYLFFSMNAREHRDTKECVLEAIIAHNVTTRYFGIDFKFTDKFKLISKYKYYNRRCVDHTNRKTIPIRVRDDYVIIQNLRSKEKYKAPTELVERFSFLYIEMW